MTAATTYFQGWWKHPTDDLYMLAMLCLMVSNNPNSSFQWNGENGEARSLTPEGPHHRELTFASADLFRKTLNRLRNEFGLSLESEASWTVPLESDSIEAQIRIERRDLFPYLIVTLSKLGDPNEVDSILQRIYDSDGLPLGAEYEKGVSVRGLVVDQHENPISGVRLSDRASNWNTEMMDAIKGPKCSGYGIVVLTDDEGRFELEVRPSIYIHDDQAKGTIRFRAPDSKNWQSHFVDLEHIRNNPDVKIVISQVGNLEIETAISSANELDHFESVVISKSDSTDTFYQKSPISPVGRQTIEGLMPGTYFISIGKNDRHYARKCVDVESGQTTEIQFTDSPGKRKATVKIQVDDASLLKNYEVVMTIFSESYSCWERANVWLDCKVKKNQWTINQNNSATATVILPPFVGGVYGAQFGVHRNSSSMVSWNESNTNSIYRPFKVTNETINFEKLDGKIQLAGNHAFEFELEQGELEKYVDKERSGDWWSQQSEQLQLIGALLLYAAKTGATHAMFDGHSFMVLPNSENVNKGNFGFSINLGSIRFDNTVRDFKALGIPEQISDWAIKVNDQEIVVKVKSDDKSHRGELNFELVHDVSDEAIDQVLSRFPGNSELRLIKGRVVDHRGKPVTGAKVLDGKTLSVFGCPESRCATFNGREVTTDSSGMFELLTFRKEYSEPWTERVLFVSSPLIQNARVKITSDSSSGPVDDVVLQLPKPADVKVVFDFEKDDLDRPFRLFYISPDDATYYCQTIVVDLKKTKTIEGLAPGVYYFALGRMGQQLERQRIELKTGESKLIRFTSPPKISLTGRVVCSQPLSEDESIRIGFNDKVGSPWDKGNWNEPDQIFEDQQLVFSKEDFVEGASGDWIVEFPVHYLIGGRYEIWVSFQQSSKPDELQPNWNRFGSLHHERLIEVPTPPSFAPLDLEFEIEPDRKLNFSITQTRTSVSGKV